MNEKKNVSRSLRVTERKKNKIKDLTATALWKKRKPQKFAEKPFRLNEVPPKL